MVAYRPHDLLWARAWPQDAALPDWVCPQWLAMAPVVVRRAPAAIGRIAVGLRGTTRNQRHAAEIDASAVLRCVTPEMLAASVPAWPDCHTIEALHHLKPLLDATGWAWGPTGSVGFALASGLPVLRTDSDLDLVLRMSSPPDAVQADALRSIVASVIHCRLDLQIDTGAGGFAYAEWAAGRPRVLLKTDHGPLLTASPWEPR
ncbi:MULTISPECIES: malonate decarboxylase holo-ACP synthase [unclassified Janthinobacterium]|uniref:malonate decarboxylase holo-ACP synthase n=1 Tax=unclassified Janthinobacterium TaxID=2610881 RepID=UPI00161A4245|nr:MULTISPECIES: malonate decarboxylase holo-ACP synthase [unclassified Janthinobacterium]MBB5371293.1 phosphoribosyl-dephospho-CoA transferase [Janthinobacterium sp. K2C7]MBB5384099.1 phosphoribosyl-dephospho-CoA transferase [Janthinobacterium sp. K2Li3]MBB5389441.1 phosphoribosyl-dephospho-CoA transferase [Janthinobacterium sp. K2E3]